MKRELSSRYGEDIAVQDGSVLVVGARKYTIDSRLKQAGLVYLYVWETVSGKWVERSRLFKENATGNAQFGGSLEVDEEMVYASTRNKGGKVFFYPYEDVSSRVRGKYF